MKSILVWHRIHIYIVLIIENGKQFVALRHALRLTQAPITKQKAIKLISSQIQDLNRQFFYGDHYRYISKTIDFHLAIAL